MRTGKVYKYRINMDYYRRLEASYGKDVARWPSAYRKALADRHEGVNIGPCTKVEVSKAQQLEIIGIELSSANAPASYH